MGAGGPPHAHLTRVREAYPLSLHGVGLSIGGAGPLDTAHLDRLRALVDRYQPASVSEHLAWSTHQGSYFNDLLALPLNRETLASVIRHVDRTQTHLGRRILIENPSTYVTFEASDIPETAFLAELSARTGCGLLLDVNNVHVSCINRGDDPVRYIDAFPLAAVEEIHLAGHATDTDETGCPLLIDTHDRPASEAVLALYAHALDLLGPRPTLIEWDGDVPAWDVLEAEVRRAEAILNPAEIRHVA